MNLQHRWCALAAALAIHLSCGPATPSDPVSGNWQFTHGKSMAYEMTLIQTDDEVSGKVCAYALFPLAAPVREATVSGRYPNIRFTDPWDATCTYRAVFEADRNQIAGDCEGRRIVRFNRSEPGRCQLTGVPPP
jgi:hypothetical protein